MYFAFDFYEYRYPPKVPNEYRDHFHAQTLGWAQLKDNILYVSTGYNGYADESYGQNAYLNAIDVDTGRLLWRSRPLVSKSVNFLLYGDAIITGYGFSGEQHFLYVINLKDGRIVQKILVSKTPIYILNKGDRIYVLTWASNLVFKVTG